MNVNVKPTRTLKFVGRELCRVKNAGNKISKPGKYISIITPWTEENLAETWREIFQSVCSHHTKLRLHCEVRCTAKYTVEYSLGEIFGIKVRKVKYLEYELSILFRINHINTKVPN